MVSSRVVSDVDDWQYQYNSLLKGNNRASMGQMLRNAENEGTLYFMKSTSKQMERSANRIRRKIFKINETLCEHVPKIIRNDAATFDTQNRLKEEVLRRNSPLCDNVRTNSKERLGGSIIAQHISSSQLLKHRSSIGLKKVKKLPPQDLAQSPAISVRKILPLKNQNSATSTQRFGAVSR